MISNTPDFFTEVKSAISDKLFNPMANEPQHLSVLVDQYKLLVDAAHKADDRRVNINNFFITINGIFVPFIINTFPLQKHNEVKLFLLFILISVGIAVCWEWMSIMGIYKKLNYINHATIKSFEEKLTSYAFSIRNDILAYQTDSPKANAILNHEMLIPKLFVGIYILYFILNAVTVFYT